MGNKYDEETRFRKIEDAEIALEKAERAHRNFAESPNAITRGQLEFKIGWLKHTIKQIDKNEATFHSEE